VAPGSERSLAREIDDDEVARRDGIVSRVHREGSIRSDVLRDRSIGPEGYPPPVSFLIGNRTMLA